MLFWAAYAVCALVAAGGVVFYALVLLAARQFRRQPRFAAGFAPPITILKSLAGPEQYLEENLRTFFKQDYPRYQIVFAACAGDPAAEIARRLMDQHPRQDAELVITGEPEFPNRKAWSLHHAVRRAQHDILIVSDSDVRAAPDLLNAVAAEFADPRVGVVTCLYRAIGASFWSRLEALTVNSEFWCAVLVARMLEGMKFAVGPTMALRRDYLDKVGGFAATADYLAEDFVLGQWAERHGYKAALCPHVVDHFIGGLPWWSNLKHRFRWARSTRRSRPWGYLGQIFTNPLPFALPLLAGPVAPLAAAVLLARAAVVATVAVGLLRDPFTRKYWWLVPIADILSLLVWISGFFGNTVEWRGHRYRLTRDGRLAIIRR